MLSCTIAAEIHSHPVSIDEVRSAGCFATLPVRRSSIWRELEGVAASAQQNRRKNVDDDTPHAFHGIDKPIIGAWGSLVLPDLFPDRLKSVAWTAHIFFLTISHASWFVQMAASIFDEPESVKPER